MAESDLIAGYVTALRSQLRRRSDVDDLVCEVEITGEAATTDIDTPEALAAWRARSSEKT